MQVIQDVIERNRQGRVQGIYSVCTAHPLVIEAALLQGLQDGQPVCIEATANQVNQFGGYTGMQAVDFVERVGVIADSVGFSREQIIFGGDHLGPVCWTDASADEAMEKAKILIASYVEAGFKKIHLDTSMPCADDVLPLADELVADRAALLCQVAEQTAQREFGVADDLVYIIGTEVPPPGGATEEIDALTVTAASHALKTVDLHHQAFTKLDLAAAWPRVVGLVVQPGVEFDHTDVYQYRRQDAQSLSRLIQQLPNMIYEAHSTDYQLPTAYCELVQDHFAILKVGPQLTYALREALFALAYIEQALLPLEAQSNLIDQCEQAMLDKPGYWQKYYPEQGPLYRRYSYSDRIRYYWTDVQVVNSVEALFANLEQVDIPLPLLQQYMPLQYQAVRKKEISCQPKDLVIYHIMQVTAVYAEACYKQEK